MSTDPNIKITIASAYDPTGTNQAQAALRQTQATADGISDRSDTDLTDDLVTAADAASTVNKEIKSLSTEAKKSGDEIKNINKKTEEATTAAGRLKKIWASYKSMVSTTTTNVAKITGAIGLMGLGITIVRGVYRYFTAESRAAHEKQAEALKAATEKCRDMQKALEDAIARSKELAAAQAGRDRLDEILSTHRDATNELQKQLEIVRARAAVEMEIKGYGMKAERYKLENQRDRGEITEFQYTKGIRDIEDQESGARYAANLQNGMDEIKNLKEQKTETETALNNLRKQKDELEKGNDIALSEPQRRQVEKDRDELDRVIKVWDQKIQALEDLNLEWTQPYQEALGAREHYQQQKQKKEAALTASDTWLQTGDHGGTHEEWTRLKNNLDEQIKTKNDEIKNLGQNITSVQTGILNEGRKHTAEQEAVAARRTQEDLTTAASAADNLAIKEAVGTLTSERDILKEATQGLADAARIDADEISKQAEAMNEIAADTAKLGNSGKDAQKFMADFQRLASSGDLSGQQATLAEMGSKLELLLNNGTFDKTQYDTLGKILEHMNSMAGYQLRAKDNEAKITEIDQKIAQIETLPILKRNLLADESGSQAMAEVYSSHLKGLQQQVEAGSEAERAVADSLNDLSDGYLDTQEAQRMADNAERLLQSHDAAAQQIGGFLKTVVSSYGEASSILQDTRFQVSSARAQMESIRAKNNQAYTAK